MKIVLIALVLALACFQTLRVESAVAVPEFMLLSSGTSKSVNPATSEPTAVTDEFSRNDAAVYAWFVIGYTLPTNATYTWKWYDPAGALYRQTLLNHSGNGPNLILGEPLNVQEVPIAKRMGVWLVEVYIDDVLLFKQNFIIGKYLVLLSVKGLPKALNTTVTVDGNRTEQIQGSTGFTFQFDEGTSHTIVVETIVQSDEATRYVNASFTGPLNVAARKQVLVTYTPQYYLEVESLFGNPQGSGWYDKGANANFSVSSPVYDYLAIKHTLTGWTGDYVGTEAEGTIEMDGPRMVEALWENDYTITYILIALIIIVIVIASLVIAKKRMKRASTTEPT